ncbi:MAG: alpha/beta fold hydrolase [Halobacterium sp.]
MSEPTATTHEEWTRKQSETTVDVDGHDVEVAYFEDGDPSDHTLLFVHGIPTWSFLWRDVAPAFADDYHVLAVDLAGYGNSEKWDGFDRSIRAQEQVVDGLLADRGADDVSLVAHDIGGGVALRYACHQPARVRNLVLSNAVCYDSWPVEFVSDLGLPETADAPREELEAKLDFAFGDGLHGDASDHEAFVEGMKAPWLSEDGKRSLARNAVATNTNHTTELDYGAVTADTCCLWGVDDVLQPVEYAERLVEDVSGDAELVELADAYHWVVEDRAETYRRELRAFLAD